MKSIISILVLFSTLSVLSGQTTESKIKIVFRFDDYMLQQHIVFDSLLYIFKKNNIPISIGVVPFGKDGLFYNKLNEEQLNDLRERIKRNEVEIALHGFNHNDNNKTKELFFRKPIVSEFYGMNYNEQVAKIKKGKETLDSLLSIRIKVFIPPYNSYDDNTLKALDSLGFKVLSAGLDGPSNSEKISYIPYTVNDLTKLPELLRLNRSDSCVIVVNIHPYSFTGEIITRLADPINFSMLDTLLKWINTQNRIIVCNYLALEKSGKFDNKRFALNSLDNNILIKILDKFELYKYGVYNTAEYQRNHRIVYGVFNILFHILIFISVYFATTIFSKFIKSIRLLRIAFIFLFPLIVLGVLYKAINSHAFIAYLILLITAIFSFGLGLITVKKTKYQET